MDSGGHAIGSDTLQQKLLEPKLEGHPDHSPLQHHNQLDQSIQPSPHQPQHYQLPTHRPPPHQPTQAQLPPADTSQAHPQQIYRARRRRRRRGQAWQRTNNNMNITNNIYILDGRSPAAMDIINRCLQVHSRWNRPY